MSTIPERPGPHELDRSHLLIETSFRGGIPLRLTALVSQMAAAVIFSRWLGAQNIGHLASALAIVGVISLVFGMQLGIQSAREEINFARQAWAWAWVFGIAAAGAGLIISNWIAPETESLLLVAYTPVLLMSPPIALLAGALGALGRARPALLLGSVSPIVRLVLIALMVVVLPEPTAIAIAAVDGVLSVGLLVYGFRASRPSIEFWRKPRGTDLKRIMWSAPPLQISALGALALSKVDILMVSWFLTPGETGSYYVIVRIAEAVLALYSAGVSLFLPAISRLKDGAELSSVYFRSAYVLAWFTTPLLSLLAVYGDVIIADLFGQEFRAPHSVYIFVALGLYAQTVTGPNGLVLLSRHRHTALAMISSLLLVSNIALNWLLIPLLGLPGAALATSVGYLWANGIALIIIRKHMGRESGWSAYVRWAAVLGTIHVGVSTCLRIAISDPQTAFILSLLAAAAASWLIARMDYQAVGILSIYQRRQPLHQDEGTEPSGTPDRADED